MRVATMAQDEQVQFIGTSRAISDLQAEVERVARSDAKVLITGESGAGKEVVARAINAASVRARVAFVPVNCAGIPESLLESELFGHVKGSFTGAYRDKPGKLEMADNGTIFLDEIGEMTLRMQGLLLRFLETGEIQKVGAERVTRTANVRVMAATNRDLRDLITRGQFREDLFYRINVIHVIVPSLRERREDIPLLAEYFLRQLRTKPTANRSRNPEGDVISTPCVRAFSPRRWRRSPNIRGQGTCGSCRTSSNGSSSPDGERSSRRTISQWRFARRAIPICGRGARGGGRSRMIFSRS